MGDRQLVCCPKSGTSSLRGSVFYVLLTFFPFRYPLQIPLSRPKFEVLLPLQPGFYIIVSKCVQAIGTIIWKCSKENRDVRDLPDRQRFFRVDRDNRELLRAIKWKPLSGDGDHRDDPNGPRILIFS